MRVSEPERLTTIVAVVPVGTAKYHISVFEPVPEGWAPVAGVADEPPIVTDETVTALTPWPIPTATIRVGSAVPIDCDVKVNEAPAVVLELSPI